MPTDTQARVLLNLLVGRSPDQPFSKLHWLDARGWENTSRRGLTPAGRDALARWLLRGLR